MLSPKKRFARYWTLAIASALVAVGCAACGSSDSQSSPGGANSTEAGAKCTAEAQKRYEADSLADPTAPIPAPTTPVDASGMAGKRVALISGSQSVPVVKNTINAVQSALAKAGIKADVFDTKSQVSLQAQTFSQVVGQHYDAIYMDGVDPTAVTAGTKAAAAAGIPIVAAGEYPNDSSKYPVLPDLYAMILTNDKGTGKTKADYALWKTNCGGGNGQYAVMTVDYGLFKVSLQSTLDEIKSVCPGCSAKSYQIDFVHDIVGSSRANALAAVNQNPNLSGILTADVWSIYQAEAVHQSANGKNVPFFSEEATPDGLPLVKSGQVAADLNTTSSSAYAAWTGADLVVRGLAGQKLANEVTSLPLSMVTADVAGRLPSFNDDFQSLQPEFLKLWGIK